MVLYIVVKYRIADIFLNYVGNIEYKKHCIN